MQELLQELQRTLLTSIPFTQHLHLTVQRYDTQGVALAAPLEGNSNHAGTAFAGSLNALVTLSGWGMLWLLLKELALDGEIVIQDSHCDYRVPVTRDFTAFCYKPDPAAVARFGKVLRARGKARLEIQSVIYEDDRVAVAFSGRYVVQQRVPRR
ncbi:thioesterase domain-containing protein [Thermosporothrix hazakensis]|jgi:thioesterase domain-containing protein|uniref:Thioesterase domain-containing protein n=2 Tax=Thermosporothrix TaxID=768650 RepID=A0A326U5A6_THEHA|nr:YiiD C-terminal domain-containing protein [Thermosporothrix hazakensis]PZW27515.1 thioesterase domain-containing protein [Thermosporothrix hazakensis]BBH85892.1 hypothetical protein KTC_06430 [Thermosporothrix sp. COM3]GCE45681.1 hypothetical protein KTH_05500 [Thermosporothrix hazakensis]